MRSSFICNCLHVTLLLFLFSACPTTHSSDYEVLLKLKSSMMGPQGSGLEDWKHYLSPTAHCSFSGVSCDHDSQVISLNMSNIPLFDFIPPEIGLLNKLVNLTLAADNLTGMLPMEMANLTSLKVLNVSNNVFYGNFPGEITLGMTEQAWDSWHLQRQFFRAQSYWACELEKSQASLSW